MKKKAELIKASLRFKIAAKDALKHSSELTGEMWARVTEIASLAETRVLDLKEPVAVSYIADKKPIYRKPVDIEVINVKSVEVLTFTGVDLITDKGTRYHFSGLSLDDTLLITSLVLHDNLELIAEKVGLKPKESEEPKEEKED